MKKNFYIITAAILSLVACSRNQEVDVPDANLSLFARTESPADTKTVVESGVHVFWEPGDEIAVFTGEQSAKFTTDLTAASGTATFKGTFGDTTWPEDLDLWAVYPFSEDATFDGETITTTLPSEQVARVGSFGKDMNLAIAHSNSSTLQFYNVGGGIRFSVTEEGIKKVMFEGLSGEIISGKVKIGLDENGKPEVKEVIGGSQFITLLPPSGQEAFEPGAWYYIVAIPGALEGGYKLRFYKDTDYARKVSEKAAVIKRSFFGNIEKADMGIEYEATTTHFPETEEEFDYSIEWTKTIGETIDKLIAENAEKPLDSIVAQIESIEGVSFVTTNMAKSTIMVMQKDSVWINYLLDTDVNHFLSPLPHSESMAPAQVRTSIIGGGKNGKALILAPFQDSFSQSIDTWKQWLASAFDEVKVRTNTSDTPTEERPEIMRFDGDELSQYNFIIIATHGGTGFYAKMKESIWSSPTGDESSWVAEQTVLASCTKYSKKTVNDLKKHHSVEEIAIVHVDNDYYLAMTPKFLKDLEFKDVGVMLQACSSSQIVDEGHDGSMVQAFLKKKAAFVTGYDKMTNEDLSNVLTSDFLYGICKGGLSVRDSYNFWQFSQLYPSMQSAMLLQAHSLGANVKDSALDFRNFKLNEAKEVSPYYTRNWSPILNTPDITDNTIEYSWTCALSPYEYSSHLFTYDNFTGAEGFLVRTEVFYDVYVDGLKISPPDLSETALKIDSVPSPKNHSWYVVARLMKGDSILASYQSSTQPFTVTEEIHYEIPAAIDLGLPSGTKWASFNLGATKPEEYGYYYAWGETEPKETYSWETYKWSKGTNKTIIKYCDVAEYGYNGYTDHLSVLEPDDDAAHVILGGKWRMPTSEECSELINECDWVWDTKNGVKGFTVTSKNNGEWIFIPATGSASSSTVWNAGYWGDIPSSTLDIQQNDGYGHQPYFCDGIMCGIGWGYEAFVLGGLERCGGYAIRPVYDDSDSKPKISASPTSINYGNVKVGEGLGNATGRVTFTNTGGSDLLIYSFDCPDGFSHSSAYTFPIVISPGNDRTIVFAFKPTEAKTYSGYVQVNSNASNGVCKVYVTGNGIE